MSLLNDFAEWFKVRKVPIKRWYSDDVGRWAFRVEVDGQTFICAARKTRPSKGTTSVMKRIAGRAQTRDALVCLRLPDDETYVFDPVAVLAHGEADDILQDDRKKRGEVWVRFPLSIGCRFEEWYDGTAEPAAYGEVDAF